MSDLLWIVRLFGEVSDVKLALVAGVAAGIVFGIISYFRERKSTVERITSMRRFNQALALIIYYQYLLMKTHKDMHPEAPLPLDEYVKGVIEIGIPVSLEKYPHKK